MTDTRRSLISSGVSLLCSPKVWSSMEVLGVRAQPESVASTSKDVSHSMRWRVPLQKEKHPSGERTWSVQSQYLANG